MIASFIFASLVLVSGPPIEAITLPPVPVLLVPNACSVAYSTEFPRSSYAGQQHTFWPLGADWDEPGFWSRINGLDDAWLPVFVTGYLDTNTLGVYTLYYHVRNPISGKLGTWQRIVEVVP